MKYIFLIFVFFLPIQSERKEPNWLIKLRKVEILKSKKEDVEKIFNFPQIIKIWDLGENGTINWMESIEYETKDGYLEVYYSIGRCSEINYKGGYDVESGVVVKLIFIPHKLPPLKQMNFDYKSFDTAQSPDVEDALSAGNREIGVDIDVVKEKLTRIEFSIPSTKRLLTCDEVLKIPAPQ